MKYGLHDDIPARENIVYAMQQLVLFVANCVILPVTAGYALGFEQTQVAMILQSTFVLCGVMTLLQLKWGHQFSIQDGPAGLWAGLILAMAISMPALGKSLEVLRTDLETGVVAGGLVVMLLGASGLIVHVSKLFTPIINGLVTILMVLQVSFSVTKGMIGVDDETHQIEPSTFIISMVTLIIILLINYYGRGFIQSIAIFIGIAAGWILTAIMGKTVAGDYASTSLISLPKFMSWGKPTFDLGITITCIIGSLMLLSMSFAALTGMSELVEEEISEKKLRSAVGLHGLSSVMTGSFGTIGFMTYISSIGVVQMTGIATTKPLKYASWVMILLGIIGPIGVFFSTIPPSVGNCGQIMIFALCIGQGLKEFRKVEFTGRENLIVGLSLTIGTGIMFMPADVFIKMPQIASCVLSNGLIVGMMIAFLLEHVVLRRPKQ